MSNERSEILRLICDKKTSVYDRQYTPYLLNRDGVIYVPAESVYAVIEVKQKLNKKYVEYASDKILSVRRLKRTSGPIYTAEGKIAPIKPKRVVGGLVCLKSASPLFFK